MALIEVNERNRDFSPIEDDCLPRGTEHKMVSITIVISHRLRESYTML